MKAAVLIPAAGASKRFAGAAEATRLAEGPSKVEAVLGGRPVFMRAVECFQQRRDVGQIILAVNPDRLDAFKLQYGDRLGFFGVQIIAGGHKERWQTVLNALGAVEADCTHVVVHDAARPLLPATLVDRLFEAATRFAAVISGLPVTDTLKRVRSTAEPIEDQADAILGTAGKQTPLVCTVERTIDRTDLVHVQTPQIFARELIQRAYAQVTAGRIDVEAMTDDAGLVEALGEPVHVVEGDPINLKITRPDDLKLAQMLLAAVEAGAAGGMARKRLFVDDDDA